MFQFFIKKVHTHTYTLKQDRQLLDMLPQATFYAYLKCTVEYKTQKDMFRILGTVLLLKRHHCHYNILLPQFKMIANDPILIDTFECKWPNSYI